MKGISSPGSYNENSYITVFLNERLVIVNSVPGAGSDPEHSFTLHQNSVALYGYDHTRSWSTHSRVEYFITI